MKFLTKEVKIALVAILGIVVLFFGMNFLKGLTMFGNDNTYFMSFKDVTGLAKSSPIYADGYKVGVVKDIVYDYENNGDIKVAIGLDKKVKVPKGSTAEIVSDLLGNVSVRLLLGERANGFLQTNDVIAGDVNAGAMGKVAQMVPAIEKMLPKLDSILLSLNTILADPSIANSLHNIEGITARLTTTSAELNTLMNGLNKNVPGLMSKADGVLSNTDQLTKNLAAVDVNGTMKKVDQTLANLQQMSNKLNSNSGSLGLLMNDASLYKNLNSTLMSADSLLNNLRAQPKRYVHFSLFGKKNK